MAKDESKKQEKVLKDVAFYQELISAWASSRMEKDKQLLTLSALAIGLLMIFWPEINDFCSLFIWLVVAAPFVISIIIILQIFSQNSDYIEQVIQNNDQEKKKRLEKSLECKTWLASKLFICGVILTIGLVIYRTVFLILKGA